MKYCIAGNFWGRNPRILQICGNFWGRNPRILQICSYSQKFFSAKFWGLWHPLAWQKRTICESFICENRILHQFAKVFSFENFPLYGNFHCQWWPVYVCTTSNQNQGGGLRTRLLVPCVHIFRLNCSLKLKVKTATKSIRVHGTWDVPSINYLLTMSEVFEWVKLLYKYIRTWG